jgi:hypothetical protein
MRINLTFAFGLWASLATAAPYEKRQTGSLLDMFGGNAAAGTFMESGMSMSNSFTEMFADKPAKITDIKGMKNTWPNSKHKRYWFGPYDVPAGKVR